MATQSRLKAPMGYFVEGTTDRVIERLFPTPSPWSTNPIGWVRSRLGEHMWSKQRQIARSVVKNRYTAVHSCHDSGKSFTASRLVAWWIDSHPPGSAFAVTTAPTTEQVDAILWREIGRAHRKGELVGRITLDSKWRLGPSHGEELVAYGRKPSDYNPEAFQGIHQQFVLVVIDEANGVPKMLYDAVDTLVTNQNARVLAIGNPDSRTSHFYSVCQRGSGWNVIHIDGFKTPNFTGEPVPAELLELLLSTEWVDERRHRWGEGSPMWESKVRGRFPEMADDVLVQMDWWEAAADRKIQRTEEMVSQFGYDVARYGVDKTMCYRNDGGILRRIWDLQQSSTTEVSQRIMRDLVHNPGVPAVVDETGVGAGVVDQLKEADYFVWGFTSGKQASDSRFVNLRSEAYWHLRELFEFGLVDVDPDDDELKNQLTMLKWKLDSKGRVVVESKEEYMRRTRTKSPDAADSAMMACWQADAFDVSMLNHAATPALTADLLEAVW